MMVPTCTYQFSVRPLLLLELVSVYSAQKLLCNSQWRIMSVRWAQEEGNLRSHLC